MGTETPTDAELKARLTPLQYQVTQKKGRRWSTARAFLDPARGRPNLRVEIEAYTTRIVLEGNRAVGVEYRQHGQTQWECPGMQGRRRRDQRSNAG